MTEKLYWSDAAAVSFEVSADRERVMLAAWGDRPSIVLPRTLFYPEGGGQLGDSGTLAVGTYLLRISDTQIGDDAVIHHVLAEPPPAEVVDLLREGASIHGAVDAARRRDHTTQHTAQHALSRALADEARAETVSARLGTNACTIDVARGTIPDVELHRAEDAVADLVTRNVVVRSLHPAPHELAKLPLRKQPTAASAGDVRIIEIEGFDMTPCGGTHCARTGQIGQLRIVGIERYKGGLRLMFHAGLRALADARAKHAALTALASDLTCGVLDVPGAVTKLRGDLKGTRAQLDAVRAELAGFVAKTTLAALPPPSGTASPIVLPVMRANDDVGALRVLAGKLADDARVIALCGAIDPASGELILVVQRGSAAKLDCGSFVLGQAKVRSGRGGGRPERAEGRFPRGTSLEVLAAAAGAAQQASGP